jgi:hypothetical protein
MDELFPTAFAEPGSREELLRRDRNPCMDARLILAFFLVNLPSYSEEEGVQQHIVAIALLFIILAMAHAHLSFA